MQYRIQKRIQWLLTVWLFHVFYIQASFAQFNPYPFKQFPLPADLPPIFSWYEDHRGFIWLGTNEGLYQFDGIQFTFYASKDIHAGLGREVITYIMEDHNDALWIGARSGVYRLDPVANDFIKYAATEETYAYYMHAASDSSFIIQGVNGIYMFYPASNRWDQLDVGIEPAKIFTALRGSGNVLWIGTDNVIRQYDLHDHTIVDYSLPKPNNPTPDQKVSVNSMFLDSRKQLWINTWFKGFFRFDPSTATFTSFDTSSTKSDYLLSIFNPSCTEDSEGNIWIASPEKGINIYNPASGNITHILKQKGERNGLVGNALTVMRDREKNIWIKSDRALHYLSRESPILHTKSDAAYRLPEVIDMEFLDQQYLLVGTYFGLYGVDTKTTRVTNLSSLIQLPEVHSAEYQFVSDITIDGDHLWLTSPQGLRQVTFAWSESHTPVFQYMSLFPTREGFWPSRVNKIDTSLFFVKGRTNTTVFAIFNAKTVDYTYSQLPDSMLINQVAVVNKDTLLMAIRNKGLYYYAINDSSFHLISWRSYDDVIQLRKPVFYDIQLLHDGTYAISTENYGVLLFDRRTAMYRQIDVAPIANTNLVFGVEEDRDHNLWIQTSTQLLFYNRATNSLSKTNLSNAFTGSSPFYFMHRGNELYATFEGTLSSIPIDELISNKKKPKLYFQSVRAGDRELKWKVNERIRLPYSDNFITYEFVGLDYDNPDGVQYWYRIPEISSDWIFLDNQSSLRIGRLPPGTYHISLKTSNDAGMWSDIIEGPEIRISPPFWKTWWFILGLAAIASLFITYLIRMRKIKIDAELALRNQIARDLHDDIGSTLSGIKIYSSIASDLAEGQPELSPLLKQISDKSDVMMQSMSDIVWSINPAYDSLHDMMVRLKQYMSEVLESQNMDVVYTAHTDLRQAKISLLHRKELYLALKEIINNIARHSQCHVMRFDIAKERASIIIRIADDGIGMDSNHVTPGNGLRNIETRIRQMGGTIIRESKPGHGVQYEIHIKTV